VGSTLDGAGKGVGGTVEGVGKSVSISQYRHTCESAKHYGVSTHRSGILLGADLGPSPVPLHCIGCISC
jgi:hypothetical protein